MESILNVVHYVVSVLLILLVLLQTGRGADVGAAFGAGASQSLFGAGGGVTLLNKVTTAVATIFFVTSLSLAQMAKNKATDSVFDSVKVPNPVPAETVPVEKIPESGVAPVPLQEKKEESANKK